MSFLSRVFGVRPRCPHAVRVQRDLVIPAGDGVPLLANRFYPADIDRPPLVLLLSPYGRGVALDRMPQLLAERGYQVLYVSLRGTGGSGGDFDGFTIHPADADGTLSWLREQPWFGGVLATWGASYLGFAQWELAARDIPEWKIAVIQDAPSEFAHLFMYPGGGFALGNALGWVQIVDRMFRANGDTGRQFLGVFTGPKALRRAAATLPVADADVALTGRRVRWFQEWIRHGPDDPYWQATDHRGNVGRMPPVVYLQGGWYDFFLPGMLADHAALRTAGRAVRLLIGPWGHGRGLYTRVGMRDALAALDAALADGISPSGVRLFVTGSRRWTDLPGWPPPARATAWYLQPAGRLGAHPASAGPPSRFRYDPADPTPSVAGTVVGLAAGPADNRRLEARPDVLTFTGDPQPADLDVIGPVRVRLYVQASVAYIDLHARLCDITPRGRSINISDGIVRLTDAAPGTPHPVEFDLWPVAHAFQCGHRIRLQVSGGAHPRYGRNLGTAEPFATSTRLQASDRTVFHDAQHPSAVWLPVRG
ncbi:MAG TPA: CocE/NonD family hydrolase [Propionibacteriaceae bacterium]